MAEVSIGEMRGKTEDEIFALLDRRTDALFEKEGKLRNTIS
jgi:hypothetical protein